MVELQILCKVLKDRSLALLELNGITEDYFTAYAAEYNYIIEHMRNYGSIPDKETFVSKFPEFTIVDVSEPDKYLVETINEERLYALGVPVLNKIVELMQTNAYDAFNYLHSKLPELQVKSFVMGTDIISQSRRRYDQWREKQDSPEKYIIPTGFIELDSILNGWQRGEELVVLFARTGQGKSWILIKSLEHAWKNGYRVGLLEPEMSDIKTGYRFDTVHGNISNRALTSGGIIGNYEEYVSKLETGKTPFFVTHPKDFQRKVTVSKLKSFVKSNNIQILGIDGISYLTDERWQKGDSRTTQLTNISEDLMDLSIELGIPVIVVCQSNREGAKQDDAPDLENIRDSDGIAFNASVVMAIRQKGPGVELSVRKNRNGESGNKLVYMWDIDAGKFEYVPNEDDYIPYQGQTNPVINAIEKFGDGSEVF